MPQPIRREGIALADDACCHSCANIWTRRILGFSDLKKREVTLAEVLDQYSATCVTGFYPANGTSFVERSAAGRACQRRERRCSAAMESAPASALVWSRQGSLEAPLRQAFTALPDQRDGGCELAEG
jgi:hypothetical protein